MPNRPAFIPLAFAISWAEYRLCCRRISHWLLVAAAFGVGILFCTPYIRFFAEGAGGDRGVNIARNSTFATSVALSLMSLVLTPFVAAIAADAAQREQRAGLTPIVATCPLSQSASVFLKWCGAAAATIMVPVAFVSAVLIGQLLFGPSATLAAPSVVAPLAALVQFGIPFLLVISAIVLGITIRTGRSHSAYALMTAIAVGELCLFVAMSRPEHRWLVTLDPIGILFLARTASSGLNNSELNAIRWFGEPALVVNRLALMGVLAGALIAAVVTIPPARVRRRPKPIGRRGLIARLAGRWVFVPEITMRPWLLHLVGSARAELRLLRHEESVLIFTPIFLILVWVIIGRPVAAGPFVMEPLAVTSTLAQQSLWAVIGSLFVFGTVLITESVIRDDEDKTAALVHATPVCHSALVGGKFVAVILTSVAYLAISGALIALYQTLHPEMPFRMKPLIDLYGLIAFPVLAFGLALAMLLAVSTRSRHATHAALVGVLGLYAWSWLDGNRHWLYNVTLAGLFNYSDWAQFGFLSDMILLQRGYLSAVTALLLVMTAFASARHAAVLQSPSARQRRAALVLVVAIALQGGGVLARTTTGMWSDESIRGRVIYENKARGWLMNLPQPDVNRVDLDVDLHPASHRADVSGTYTLINDEAQPIKTVYITVNPRLMAAGSANIDDRRALPVVPGLYQINLPSALSPGAHASLRFRWTIRVPDGLPPHGDRFGAFVDSESTVLTSMFTWPWLPIVGYSHEAELLDPALRDQYALPERSIFEDIPDPGVSAVGFLRRNVPFAYRATIRVPSDVTAISSGRLVRKTRRNDRTEYVFAAERKISSFAVLAGTWRAQSADDVTVHFEPGHERNVPLLLDTARQARAFYSRVFFPNADKAVAVAEVPHLGMWSGFAFPGIVGISERLGFISGRGTRANISVVTVAHEIAHEWWGGAVWPAHAPGAQAFGEGLATYSALMFVERFSGEKARQALFQDLEHHYLRSRAPNREHALIDVDGTRMSDGAVAYHRAAIVLSMLSDLIGRETLQGVLSNVGRRFAYSRQHPTFSYLLSSIEERAPGAKPFLDEFARGSAVPNIRYTDATRIREADGRWRVDFKLINTGSGTIAITVAARGSDPREIVRAKAVVIAGGGGVATGTVWCDFEPKDLRIDPDRRVLLQDRSSSVHRF